MIVVPMLHDRRTAGGMWKAAWKVHDSCPEVTNLVDYETFLHLKAGDSPLERITQQAAIWLG